MEMGPTEKGADPTVSGSVITISTLPDARRCGTVAVTAFPVAGTKMESFDPRVKRSIHGMTTT